MNRFLNKIIHGDCLEVMKEIPTESVDMILCDLPYGTTACAWDVIIPFKPLWEQYKRIIKPRGGVVLFGSEPFSSCLRKSHMEGFKYDWVWDKKSISNPQLAKKQPLKNFELISVFGKGTGGIVYFPQGLTKIEKPQGRGREITPTEQLGHIQRRTDYIQEYTNYPTAILSFPRPARSVHPTQKPVPLLEYLIKTYTKSNEVVLDNCMGSGSTAIACMNTGRNFIGIELEEKYVEIARNRIAQEEQKNNFRLFQPSDVSQIEEEREKGLFE